MAGVQEMIGKYGPRPDIGILFKDATVKIFEVASKTDSAAYLEYKNNEKNCQ